MDRIQVNLLKDKISVQKKEQSSPSWAVPSKYDKFLNGGLDQKAIEKESYINRGGKMIFLHPTSEAIYVLDDLEQIKVIILYSDIEYVNISISSRNNLSIRYNSYQVDLDIITKEKEYYFEIFNPYSFQDLIDQLNNHQVECVDMAGVIALYKKYPIKEKRIQYLDTHFNEMAKKYALDHPRQSKNLSHKEKIERMISIYRKNIK